MELQEKWKENHLVGYDGIVFGNGDIIIADYYKTENPNNGEIKWYWSAICDTTLKSIQKYNDDVWTEVGVYIGSFEYQQQKIVFGEGSMGNEGFVASTNLEGELNWSMFFTFSNPIHKVEVINEQLVCYGTSDVEISIDLNDLTKVKVSIE